MAVLRFDCGQMMSTTLLPLLLLLVSRASAQTTSNCTSAANTLAPCLTYLASTNTSPSLLCCSAIAILNTNNPDCLCQVVAQLSASSAVNVTKAYTLPAACGVTVDTATCPAVPPGSSIAAPPGLLAFAPPPPALATPPSPSPKGNDAARSRPSGAVAAVVALCVLAMSQISYGFVDWFY